MQRLALGLLALGLLALLLAGPATAEQIRRERVRFKPGASGATLAGRIAGDDSVEYRLAARTGQVLRVTLDAKPSAAFNVFAPGALPGRDAALFVGSTAGNRAELSLAASGEYLIQLYQVRSAARRNERLSYTLRVAVTGAADALVPGTAYHATGTLPCARTAARPMAECRFGVVRDGRGGGTVTVSWPDGGERVIGFADPRTLRAGQAPMPVLRRQDDLLRVTIGTERFEFPEALLTGG